MKIAVVGGGISGLSAAWMLREKHEVTLYDAGQWLGGHTHTVDVPTVDGPVGVDTGFIVFNDRTYPNFLKLLKELGVGRQDSDMSFSVRCDATGLEYNGSTFSTLFARPSNAVSPRFLGMLRDIMRFNKRVKGDHAAGCLDDEMTLGDFVQSGGYGPWLREKYVGPMVAAIWSSSVDQAFAMPVSFFARFFVNHGLLDITNRPQWFVVEGGSRSYVNVIQAVRLRTQSGYEDSADHVIIATHSDEALALLGDASDAEASILGAIGYQENHAVLHTDASVLPRHKRAWAAWNYHLPALAGVAQPAAALTYNMNILQSLKPAPDADGNRAVYCVSLNPAPGAIDPQRVIDEYRYSHPIYSAASIAASARRAEISGTNRTSYCGAYWRNGFHEDGLVSALDAVHPFGCGLRSSE